MERVTDLQDEFKRRRLQDQQPLDSIFSLQRRCRCCQDQQPLDRVPPVFGERRRMQDEQPIHRFPPVRRECGCRQNKQPFDCLSPIYRKRRRIPNEQPLDRGVQGTELAAGGVCRLPRRRCDGRADDPRAQVVLLRQRRRPADGVLGHGRQRH